MPQVFVVPLQAHNAPEKSLDLVGGEIFNRANQHLPGTIAGVFAGVGTGYQKPVLAGGLVEIGPVSVRIIPPLPNVTPLTIGFEVGIPF